MTKITVSTWSIRKERERERRRILRKLTALMFMVTHGDMMSEWGDRFADIIADIKALQLH